MIGIMGFSGAMSLNLLSAASPPTVVNDAEIRKSLAEGIGNLTDAKKTTPGKDLTTQLERTSCELKLPPASTKNKKNIYHDCADSVVAISSVYKCNKCSNWHSSGVATAWILTADGVMVTNHHVFAGRTVAGFGVRTRDGKVYPVTEILAASKKTDVAIFRVKGSGFKPLTLGPDAQVGSDVHIIAHPDTRFYTYTSGKVSRYYVKPTRSKDKSETTIMAVTAEFARGSSGGPAIDPAGNVVGMVSTTQSIYYPPSKKSEGKKGPFQMVIRNCVPVSSIRALIK